MGQNLGVGPNCPDLSSYATARHSSNVYPVLSYGYGMALVVQRVLTGLCMLAAQSLLGVHFTGPFSLHHAGVTTQQSVVDCVVYH